jgi:hypothetical protein
VRGEPRGDGTGRYVEEETTDEDTEAAELVLSRWAELPRVDSLAAEELAGETFEHYEEHVRDLERFVG